MTNPPALLAGSPNNGGVDRRRATATRRSTPTRTSRGTSTRSSTSSTPRVRRPRVLHPDVRPVRREAGHRRRARHARPGLGLPDRHRLAAERRQGRVHLCAPHARLRRGDALVRRPPRHEHQPGVRRLGLQQAAEEGTEVPRHHAQRAMAEGALLGHRRRGLPGRRRRRLLPHGRAAAERPRTSPGVPPTVSRRCSTCCPSTRQVLRRQRLQPRRPARRVLRDAERLRPRTSWRSTATRRPGSSS